MSKQYIDCNPISEECHYIYLTKYKSYEPQIKWPDNLFRAMHDYHVSKCYTPNYRPTNAELEAYMKAGDWGEVNNFQEFFDLTKKKSWKV